MKAALLGLGLAMVMAIAAPATYALYYGPSFSVPTAISPGSNINIDLTTIASSTFGAPPSGSSSPCTNGTCDYPLQSCTSSSAFYVAIHEVVVTDPNGNQFMLGSASTSGLYWPANQGGGDSNGGPSGGHANELNITAGQADVLTFGTGATGPSGASYASEDFHPTSPFTAIADTAGPYYWWTVAGNSWGSNLRLDQNPSITPTISHGTYVLDIEGVAVCGQTQRAVSAIVFFDAPITVITPEFGSALVAVAGGVFVLAIFMRQKRKLSLPTGI